MLQRNGQLPYKRELIIDQHGDTKYIRVDRTNIAHFQERMKNEGKIIVGVTADQPSGAIEAALAPHRAEMERRKEVHLAAVQRRYDKKASSRRKKEMALDAGAEVIALLTNAVKAQAGQPSESEPPKKGR